MNNIYKILRLCMRIKSRRLKMLGIWTLHFLGKRYIGIFLDPVMSCNYRCKMCYFSDEEKRKDYHGVLGVEDMEKIAGSLFHRALKLQIGCGAEPSLYKDLVKVVSLGKKYGIPYVSITSNGALLTREILVSAIEAGLDELTLSAHGLTKETYEFLMTNGKFERFMELLADIAAIKKEYPAFKLRINYTMNNRNLDELTRIWEVVGDKMDIVQLRPIQKIGNTEYQDFDLTRIYEKYDSILLPLIEECKRRNIICLVPQKQNLIMLENEEVEDDSIESATYCYISPNGCWTDGFDYRTDTFESYAAKVHLGRKLFGKVLKKGRSKKVEVTRKMNYNVK